MEAKDRSAAQVGPGEGRSLWVLGELVTRKVASGQTGGAYSLFEVLTQPQGGPPPHIQHREDECFYVLEGEFEFLNDGRVFGMGPGSLVYVPRGNLHAYKNVGNGPGRMLVSQTPGGLHERFLEELGEPATDRATPPVPEGPPEFERIAEVAAEYGIEIPPSPEGGRRSETRQEGGDHRWTRRSFWLREARALSGAGWWNGCVTRGERFGRSAGAGEETVRSKGIS